MFSYQASMWPQLGQAEGGHATDCCRGRRWTQTFRKLPMMAPSAAAPNRKIAVMKPAWRAEVRGATETTATPNQDERGRRASIRTACRFDRPGHRAAAHRRASGSATSAE